HKRDELPDLFFRQRKGRHVGPANAGFYGVEQLPVIQPADLFAIGQIRSAPAFTGLAMAGAACRSEKLFAGFDGLRISGERILSVLLFIALSVQGEDTRDRY